jgi:hypothetical protein
MTAGGVAQSAMLGSMVLSNAFTITAGSFILFLALAAGSFLFLGLHAVHAEWRERGLRFAAQSTLAGAGASVILARLSHFLVR